MKEQKEQCKTIFEFYVICHKLKTTIRSGWNLWQVKAKRRESVAEHIYSTQMLALAILSEFEYIYDPMKILYLIAIHELGECMVGDITMHDGVSSEEKHRRELEAVTAILSPLFGGAKIQQLWNEFEDGQTPEAIFCHWVDKLEAGVQAKIYEQQKAVSSAKKMKHRHVEKIRREVFNCGAVKLSDGWLHFDAKKYSYDENFNAMVEWLMKNKI